MHRAVEAAQALDGLGHAGCGSTRIAQVADVAADAVELVERVGAASGREHARALDDAQLGNRAADARGRTRDEDAATLELHQIEPANVSHCRMSPLCQPIVNHF